MWVETNNAAVTLWQRLGFSIIGTVPAAFNHPQRGLVGLHIMHKPLLPFGTEPDTGAKVTNIEGNKR